MATRPNGEGLNDSFIKKLKEFDYKFIAPFDAVRVNRSVFGELGVPVGPRSPSQLEWLCGGTGWLDAHVVYRWVHG